MATSNANLVNANYENVISLANVQARRRNVTAESVSVINDCRDIAWHENQTTVPVALQQSARSRPAAGPTPGDLARVLSRPWNRLSRLGYGASRPSG